MITLTTNGQTRGNQKSKGRLWTAEWMFGQVSKWLAKPPMPGELEKKKLARRQLLTWPNTQGQIKGRKALGGQINGWVLWVSC